MKRTVWLQETKQMRFDGLVLQIPVDRHRYHYIKAGVTLQNLAKEPLIKFLFLKYGFVYGKLLPYRVCP